MMRPFNVFPKEIMETTMLRCYVINKIAFIVSGNPAIVKLLNYKAKQY